MKSIFCFFLIVSMAVSCKKESNYIDGKKSDLPNYGNIDLNKIFSGKDNVLENKKEIIATLDEYYKNVWENNDLSGSFLVAKGDEILYEKYSGFGRENNQLPIKSNTALHVASVSKTLTAMAMMKLIEAGKLKLSDPLTKFFPQFPYPEVTVQSLLTQRSGLPKYEHFIEKIQPQPTELSKKFLTNEDVLNLLIRYKPELARPTNTGFMYCNTNFALLGLVIQRITKTPFPEAMQEIIFRPLHMNDTYVFQEKDASTAAQSFYFRGPKLYPLDRLDLIFGDKNVYTTPRDLLNFSKALFAKHFLKQELQEMIFKPFSTEKPGINNYGIGFRMKIFDNGEKLTYHNGWWHGSNAVFAHLLKSNVTIIAIGNKYSQRVYSALSLSSLFENFPIETDKFNKEIHLDQDSLQTDSLKEDGNGNGE